MWLQAGIRHRGTLGVLGAILITAGAFCYTGIPRAGHVAGLLPLHALRASPHAELWGLAGCFTGLALLTAAWLLLGVAVRAGMVGSAAVHRAALLWVAPLLVAPPLFSGDGWSYAADAFLTGHGASPYVATPSILHGPIVEAVCGCWRHTPAPYGPAAMVWGGIFGRLTTSPWALMLCYRLLALIGLGLLMWAVPRLARMTGVHPASASWLVVASPFVLAVGVGGTHLDLMMAGLVAVAIAVTPTRGWLAGAALIGCAAAIKAPAAVAGIGVVLGSLQSEGSDSLGHRVRRTAEVAGVALGVLTGIGLVSGLGFGWVRAMNAALVLHTPLSLTYEIRRLWALLGLSHAKPVVDTAGVVVLVLALAWLLWRAPARRSGSAVLTAAVAMLLTTVLSPVTNYWYYLWCVPLLAVCRIPRVVRCSLGGFVVALGLIAPLDSALRIPHSASIVLGAAVVGLVAGAYGESLLDAFRLRPGLRPPPVPDRPMMQVE